MSKLEQVLELLINENVKEADAVLHEWFVDVFRNEYQQITEEDDAVFHDDVEGGDDVADEAGAEEFYNDADDNEGDDFTAGSEVESDDVGIEAEVDELKDEVEELKRQIEELLGDDSDEDSVDADADVDTDVDSEDTEGSDDVNFEVPAEDDDVVGDEEGSDDEEVKDESMFAEDEEGSDEDFIAMLNKLSADEDFSESEEMDEEEYEDLEESALDMLSAVKASNSDGVEVGTGKKIKGNDASPVVSKNVNDRVGGTPNNKKLVNTTGHDRETPPTTKVGNDGKLAGNAEKSVKNKLSKVAKGGDSKAVLNHTLDGMEPNTTSAYPGNKKRG